MTDERQIRSEINDIRKSLTPDVIASMSEKLANEVISLPCFKNATDVFLYKPIRGEADPTFIANAAVANGKRIAYPVTSPGGLMDFYYVTSESDFVSARFGLSEPDAKKCVLAEITAEKRVVIIVPGIAFGADGRRIGYGGGYYDRYLGKNHTKKVTTIGFCYPFQIRSDCPPPKPHDIPMDIILQFS